MFAEGLGVGAAGLLGGSGRRLIGAFACLCPESEVLLLMGFEVLFAGLSGGAAGGGVTPPNGRVGAAGFVGLAGDVF